MDLKQLRFFVRTVESGSISRAAQSLNMAQPSLSQRLGELEAELGVKLLHRATSGVKPTDIGLMVADRARALLRGAENLVAEAKSAGSAPSGDVMVGLPASIALHLTVPLALKVREALPGVNLRISEGMSGHILEWILAGRLDLAILYIAEPIPELEMGEIIHEDLCLISSVRAAPPEESVSLHELHRYPLVLPAPDHGLRRTITLGVQAAGAVLNVAIEVDSLTNMKRLTMEGSLHTVLPRAACLEEIEAGTLVARRIVSPPLRRPIVIVTPRERPLTLAGETVRAMLHALVLEAVREHRPQRSAD
jgi:LysR family transcriptional regulator, nitrogen assimilation regulatory protein